jgi:diaminopimelate decarboxylase
MHYFQYRKNELFCEEIPIRSIAQSVGTPFYLYSRRTLERHFRVFDAAFASVPHIVCYAVKANSNLALLKLFVDWGSGFDVVSGGELFRVLQVGADPRKVIYAGVGKREDEIDYALQSDILFFNVESPAELAVISVRAKALKKKARVSLRVNPDVDPRTHPYISTGLQKHKFGIDIKKSVALYKSAQRLPGLEIVGASCHIGSQITQLEPFVEAIEKVKDLVLGLRAEKLHIEYLDIGGGLGITYHKETPPDPKTYGEAITARAKDLDCTLVFEPGRVIVGNAGILVTRVLYTKTNQEKNFFIVDAGMNDLLRPSLYGSFHDIWPVRRTRSHPVIADVVGPVCESADFFAKDRPVPKLGAGDLVAIMSAGAYGFTLSSNYNSRPRAAEILADGERFYVIRQRESYQDLIRGESIPTTARRD